MSDSAGIALGQKALTQLANITQNAPELLDTFKEASDLLDTKVDKSVIKQETGSSETDIMSQKSITDKIDEVKNKTSRVNTRIFESLMQPTHKIFSDNFVDTNNWTVTNPENGSIAVANNIMTITDGSTTAGTGWISIRNTIPFEQQYKPFIIELGHNVQPAMKFSIDVIANNGTTILNSLLYSFSGAISNNVRESGYVTITPTHFTNSNKSRTLMYIDPIAQTMKIFLFYKGDDNAYRYIVLKDTFSWANSTPISTEYPAYLQIKTGSAEQGYLNLVDLQVYNVYGVFAGDSLAAGHTGYDPTPVYYVTQNPKSTMEYWMQNALNDKIKFHNFGYGGYTTANLISTTLPLTLGINPKLCVISIGTNDIYNDVSEETIITNLTTIITNIKNANAIPVMLSVPPRSVFSAGQQTIRANINTWLEGYCNDNDAIYVDTFTALDDPNNSGSLLPAYNGDNTHFSPLGYRVAANEIMKALIQI